LNCDIDIIRCWVSDWAASEDRSEKLAAGSGPIAVELALSIVNLEPTIMAVTIRAPSGTGRASYDCGSLLS
jgi:hypothetical protein